MRPAILVLCALLGGIGGGVVVKMVSDDRAPAPRQARERTDPAILARLDEIERRLEERPAPATPPDLPGEAAPSNRPPSEGGAAASPTAADAPKKISRATPKQVADLVAGLKKSPFKFSSQEELLRWLAKHPESVPDVIRSLEAAIKEDPKNADLHAALGSVHSSKWPLQLVKPADSPKVWRAASASWTKAIELDPNHWQARYEMAFNLSMAPEFYGLKPNAIKQFEKLRSVQETGAPESHHVHTYFRLGTLYKDMGNPDKARQVWEDGLRLFPDSAAIKGALEASSKR